MWFFRSLTLLCALLPACSQPASTSTVVRVAVASNFAAVLEELAPEFTEATGIDVAMSTGSTGLLFAQIENGAPFDVFLAADTRRPLALVEKKLALPKSAFVYAQGRLALVSATKGDLPDDLEVLLSRAPFDLAVANSRLAPFGRAALEALGRSEADLASAGVKVIRGESASQAWHFVVSGAADFGLLPLSMAMKGELPYRAVAAGKHSPIDQMAVQILESGTKDNAARFLEFLGSEEARQRIRESGYGVTGG